jgi:hypothetical protein
MLKYELCVRESNHVSDTHKMSISSVSIITRMTSNLRLRLRALICLILMFFIFRRSLIGRVHLLCREECIAATIGLFGYRSILRMVHRSEVSFLFSRSYHLVRKMRRVPSDSRHLCGEWHCSDNFSDEHLLGYCL